MATLTITHLGAGSDFDGLPQGPIYINELAVNLTFGAGGNSPIIVQRPVSLIGTMSSLQHLVATGKVSAGVVLSADEIASGLGSDGPVGVGDILANAVTTTTIAAGAVTAPKLGALAVTTPAIAAGAVTKAKAAAFVSTEQTATGASQNVAHGLGVVPAAVLVVPTAGNDGAGAAGTQTATIVEGAHTSTNVVVTVTAGSKFKVFAWA